MRNIEIPRNGKMQVVSMKMDDVEVSRAFAHQVHFYCAIGQPRVPYVVLPHCMGDGRYESRLRNRIASREQGDFMSLSD